jgi:nitroreductase
MDTYLAIASRREVRDYDDRPLPAEVEERILDAGRLAGNSKNRQPWRFHLVPPDLLAGHVYDRANLDGAALVVAIVVEGKGPTSFDAGRAAQNMLLAAWNEGVGGSPNGIRDAEGAERALSLPEGAKIAIVLSFGYPRTPRDPESRSADEWSGRARRLPLAELVVRHPTKETP